MSVPLPTCRTFLLVRAPLIHYFIVWPTVSAKIIVSPAHVVARFFLLLLTPFPHHVVTLPAVAAKPVGAAVRRLTSLFESNAARGLGFLTARGLGFLTLEPALHARVFAHLGSVGAVHVKQRAVFTYENLTRRSKPERCEW